VENYFAYFSEIEERFMQRRGTFLIVSTVDWALMESWKESGIPLEAVLRGIDRTFDKWEKRANRAKRINGLGYCSQEVMAAADEIAAMSTGAARKQEEDVPSVDIVAYLRRNARSLKVAMTTGAVRELAVAQSETLEALAAELESGAGAQSMEEVEQRLTVMEEKLFAQLRAAADDAAMLSVRQEAEAAMKPYRGKMGSAQIEQLMRQFVNKKLLEAAGLPRLSLFYMQP